MKRIIIVALALSTLAACDFLEPRPIEDLKTEELWSHADYGEGILTTVYANLDIALDVTSDYYTDNAVPNITGANRLALGSWTVENNSIGEWGEYYTMIKYLNLFIENGKTLPYNVTDAFKDSLYRVHRVGEAYFLRAWYEWKLLQNYGGIVDGEALGFPIVTEALEIGDDLDLPRDTYEDCVAQIITDCDSAISIVTYDYTSSRDPYVGVKNRGRASGIAAEALKARVLLYAASPAFNNSTQASWERAANAAAECINNSGGLTDLQAYGDFTDGGNFENIWVSSTYSRNDWEQSYYPPSLYGSGECNPSQNLVDAFPASDGYPIGQSAAYSASKPYENRDARFERFVFHNGTEYGGKVVNTYMGGDDAPGGLLKQGTRTGYYLKKFLSTAVDLTPGVNSFAYHFVTYLNRAELYLNFAEAANEAFGPTDARLGISALDAIKKIRKRGLGDIADNYLTEQAGLGKDAFRELIQNERRIELCFEGHRFWDVRRWNLPLSHTVKGMKITKSGDNLTYQQVDVEEHTYEDYMRYVPVPYDQTLIMDNLAQNAGWK
ncbi:MAG: RagB/SusD family nutrient uptake outer membrane protein [Prolixibacteraceae bacterium]|nr:RagB/SusD family nutrient uptake outer membrane protein [Prolixibacteraceae bacterium]